MSKKLKRFIWQVAFDIFLWVFAILLILTYPKMWTGAWAFFMPALIMIYVIVRDWNKKEEVKHE